MSLEGLFPRRRILVVEDEMLVAWVLEEMLTLFGCEIVGPAVRVNQALALVEAEAFDAASLDINLNGEKSYPVADALSKRGVPFFFSTGFNKDSIPDGYRHFPVLQKPYATEKLAAMLSTLLPPPAASSPIT